MTKVLTLLLRGKWTFMVRSACDPGRLWLPALLGVLLLAFASPGAAAQTIWYVDDNAPGDPGPGDPTVSDPLEDGSTAHPFDAIQEGINAAAVGDEVILADGRYTGAGNKDLDFRGKDITVRSASAYAHFCVIDCEGAGHGFYFWRGESEAALVGEIEIRNGNEEHGGGVVCSGNSNPTFRACFITGNHGGFYGGGISCYHASPTFVQCRIDFNDAAEGGGIWCNNEGNPTFEECQITWNDGGGLLCQNSSPTFNRCTFSDNAGFSCGGVHCQSSSPMFLDCTIQGNRCLDSNGGGVNSADSTLKLSNCTIVDNSAMNGGGVYCDNSNATIVGCTIQSNSADADGGGLYCTHGDLTISDCTFKFNTALMNGGGFHCAFVYHDLTLTYCTFSGNSALYGGGAFCKQSLPVFNGCTFRGNYADVAGGGLHCVDAEALLNNCLLNGNITTEGGGISCYNDGLARLNNCTLYGNNAYSGGGIYGIYDGSATLGNCILWNNAPDAIRVDWHVTVDFSDIQGGWEGAGNINLDPLLTPEGRLSAGSPCIDAGDNEVMPADVYDLDGDGNTIEPIPVDLDRAERFLDDAGMPDRGTTGATELPNVDMGAYEFQGNTCFADLNGDNQVGLADLAQLLGHYGQTFRMTYYDGDLNADGAVDLNDLAELLSRYGDVCP